MIEIVDIGRNEKSWAGFEAEKGRQERRRRLLARRRIAWNIRKHHPEIADQREKQLRAQAMQIARKYMGLS